MEESKVTNLLGVALSMYKSHKLIDMVIKNYLGSDAVSITYKEGVWDYEEYQKNLATAEKKLDELDEKFEKMAEIFDKKDMKFFAQICDDILELKDRYKELAPEGESLKERIL